MRKQFSLNKNLTDALSETIVSAENHKGNFRIEDVDLSKILLDPHNPRKLKISLEDIKSNNFSDDDVKAQEYEELETLGNTIKEHGLLNPIIVYKKGSRYILIAGERRTLASHILNLKSIPARILPKAPNDIKISILQWIENIERKQLTLWEKLGNLRKIVQHTDLEITPKNISQFMGCSKATAQNYVHLLNIKDKELLNSIENNEINGIEKAVYLSKLNKKDRKELIGDSKISALTTKQIKTKATKKQNKIPNKKLVCIFNTKNFKVAKSIFTALRKDPDLQAALDLVPEPNWKDLSEINKSFSDISCFIEELVNG